MALRVLAVSAGAGIAALAASWRLFPSDRTAKGDESLESWEIIRREDAKGSGLLLSCRNRQSGAQTSPIRFWAEPDGLYPVFLPPERLAWLDANVRLRSGDVAIVTYPKCGTTWTEQIVLLLQNGCRPDLLDPENKNTYRREVKAGKLWPTANVFSARESPRDALAGPPRRGEFSLVMEPAEFDKLPGPRVIKSHMPVAHFNGASCRGGPDDGPRGFSLQSGVRVIYVTRNPFDAAVSAFYHPGGIKPNKLGYPFTAYAKVYSRYGFAWGSWYDHVKGWRDAWRENRKQVLWVHYEELQADLPKAIARIAAFLDIKASPELVQRVAKNSTFKAMKKRAGNDKHFVHLRKGKVGDWRAHFSAKAREEFRSRYCAQMKGYGDLVYDVGNGETLSSGTS